MRSAISLSGRPAIFRSRNVSFERILSTDARASVSASAVKSAIESPAILTARLSGRSRRSLHAVHGAGDIYCVSHSRYVSDDDSSRFFSRNGKTPRKFSPLLEPPLDGLPYKIRFCVLREKFSNGVPRSNPYAAAAIWSVRCRDEVEEPGPNPPSKRGLVQSTITFAGSNSYFDPRPWHSGQAPYGELKLNERGSS